MKPEEKSKLERTKQVLDELIAYTDDTLKQRQSQIAAVKDRTSKTESQIKGHFWKAIEYILSEDKRLIRELNELKDAQLAQLHSDIDTDYKALQIYQGKMQLINQILESENDEDITDVEELCKSVNKMCLKSSKCETVEVEEIQFVYDEEMLLKAIQEVSHKIVTIPMNIPPKHPTPVFSHVFSCRTPEDVTDPDIRNVVVVDSHGVKITTVTDWTNRSIKSFYKENNHQKHSVLVTGGWPFGITSLGENTIFVTDPVLKKLLALLVYPELRLMYTLSTEKMYCGIASLGESRLIASGYEWSNSWASFWTVDIMDSKGNILKSIKDRVLQSPEYICTSREGNIVASDKGSRSLVYLSCEGDEYLTVTPTGENLYRVPQGVTVTRSGTVLLVDTMSNKVIEMTDSGEFIRDILTSEDGLEKPRSILADDEGLVSVTCGEYVRVYEYQ